MESPPPDLHPSPPRPCVLLGASTGLRLQRYAADLAAGAVPGARLQAVLDALPARPRTVEAMLDALFRTRLPMIFAESAVRGDGSDWTLRELGLLGDIGVATGVTVHDDGRHAAPRVHARPFDATLLFSSGALLQHGHGGTPADWHEVVRDGKLHPPGFAALYERRLMPVLLHAQEIARRRGRRAVVTVPGLGCGMFAGVFRGRVGPHLQAALEAMLQRHAARLPQVALVRLDPYRECDDHQTRFGATLLRVRPLARGHPDTPQLCAPRAYEEAGDDFSDCDLFSVVAWDHVSWPGNDFYGGSRATDDGVKAAATSVMRAVTGFEGAYDPRSHQYRPPAGHITWGDLVRHLGLRLEVRAEQVRIFEGV